ncbi:MAG: hypothetical protein CK427_14280 [Leptospira sp.]|nr:MAG: hypothetical protein CK427_14280 [Leptospira sp.]
MSINKIFSISKSFVIYKKPYLLGFGILCFINVCFQTKSLELPRYLPSESEIKSTLSDESTLKRLEAKARSKGFVSAKEWKSRVLSEITESDVDAMVRLDKSEGKRILNQDSNILEYTNQLKNRLAWTILFQEENISLFQKPQLPGKAQAILNKFPNLPIKGSNQAKLIIFEFSDFTCPYCRKSHEVSEEIFKKYNKEIRWVFVDFPLTDFPFQDSPSHLLGACILNEKPKLFWEYYKQAFVTHAMSSEQNVSRIAMNQYGLTEESWKDCRNGSGRFKISLQDLHSKKKYLDSLGVSSTPSFLIGGQFVQGYLPFSKFEKILKTQLNSL